MKTVVKWLQLILIVNAAIVGAMYGVQAFIRRKTRDTRMAKEQSMKTGEQI